MQYSNYKFREPQMLSGHIELVAIKEIETPAEVVAYVNGIVIGRSARGSAHHSGKVLVYCNRFPHVTLPIMVRFGIGEESHDVAPPLMMRTTAEVARLVGVGTISNSSLKIDDGVVHGTAYNAVNGVAEPVLVGRINGHTIRPIQCEKMALRDEGGGRFTYRMRMQIEDLEPSGAFFEIVSLPTFETVASISYSRLDGITGEAAISKIEAAVGMLEKRLNLEVARNGHAFDTLRNEFRAKDDALIEYIMAMALDAGTGEKFGDIKRSIPSLGFNDFVASLRLRLPAASRWFLTGWDPEIFDVESIACRTLTGCGVLLNPHSERGLVRIEFTVLTVGDFCPTIDILFDSVVAPVTIVKSDARGPYSVVAEMPDPSSVTLIRIITRESGASNIRWPIADIILTYDVDDSPAAPR